MKLIQFEFYKKKNLKITEKCAQTRLGTKNSQIDKKFQVF